VVVNGVHISSQALRDPLAVWLLNPAIFSMVAMSSLSRYGRLIAPFSTIVLVSFCSDMNINSIDGLCVLLATLIMSDATLNTCLLLCSRRRYGAATLISRGSSTWVQLCRRDPTRGDFSPAISASRLMELVVAF
jgi:hypothetical protein